MFERGAGDGFSSLDSIPAQGGPALGTSPSGRGQWRGVVQFAFRQRFAPTCELLGWPVLAVDCEAIASLVAISRFDRISAFLRRTAIAGLLPIAESSFKEDMTVETSAVH